MQSTIITITTNMVGKAPFSALNVHDLVTLATTFAELGSALISFLLMNGVKSI